MDLMHLFQGFGTLFMIDTKIAIARILFVLFGILMVYLGAKNVLEPLIMIPLGFGMAAVNAGVLIMDAQTTGTIFLDPMVSDTDGLMSALQINFLQPIYTFTFSNGLIACLIFMGIGVITDLSFLLSYPFTSMLLAMFAELGTFIVLPLGIAMGLTPGQAAAVSTIGGADAPMVLFASLQMAPELFVAITVVAYLYLSLAYAGYPFLLRLLVPKELRGSIVKVTKRSNVTSREKLIFAIVACTLLCFLIPIAAPLFSSLFLGIAIRESGVTKYIKLLEDVLLYGSSFFLALLLGTLCEARILLDPQVLPIVVLGMLSLLISGVGGIIGGYVVYFINRKNFNPAIGMAGVSCVPTTAKIVQAEVAKANRRSMVLQYAMGASISGVITSAVIAGILITVHQFI